MDKDLRDIIIVVGVTFVIICSIIGGVFAYSGLNSPLTVVESGSMQHSTDTSYVGIIDTGDMVVMRSTDNASITTFVEGYHSGYSAFGDYGDVIIYNRDSGNPVIHRAIVWLEYNETKKVWSAPSLEFFPYSESGNGSDGLWYNNGNEDYNNMTGVLEFFHMGYKDTNCSVNLDTMESNPALCHSGYLTKGDNNSGFDQPLAFNVGPVELSDIKAIAGFELPWVGCIKLYVNNTNIGQIPGNSIPCLIVMVIDVIAFFVLFGIVLEVLFNYFDERRKEAEELEELDEKPS